MSVHVPENQTSPNEKYKVRLEEKSMNLVVIAVMKHRHRDSSD